MRKVARTAVLLLGMMASMAVAASTAFAGDYNTPGGTVAGTQTGGGGGGGGTLPFTGADLLLYVVVGAAIITSGVALRAVSARRSR
jgi:hypothetical protein